MAAASAPGRPEARPNPLTRVRERVFYGWWMVACGFLVQLLVSSLLNHAYGAYVVLLREEFNWSKTSLSAGFSLFRLESGLLGPIEGMLVDRLGPRTVMRLGMVLFGLGLMLFSQVNSLPAFYASFMVIAVGSSLGGFLPITVAVVNWFQRRRATALAIMSTGFAIGGLVVPLVVFCLETFGWRETAFGSGVLVIAVGVPLAQVFRHRPEDYGMTVDGVPPTPADEAGDQVVQVAEAQDFTPREALRTPAFWLVSLGHGSALLVVSAVLVHLVSHLNENLGYSLGTAALVVTLLTATQTAGQLCGGFLGDRFSKRLLCAACMGMHMTGLLLVAYATNLAMVIAFALLHGLAWGVRGPLMQAIRADYFGRASFGMIMGMSSMITMFGNISGPLVAGFLADSTGSYEAGFTLLACLAGVGTLFFLFARRPQRKPSAVGTAG